MDQLQRNQEAKACLEYQRYLKCAMTDQGKSSWRQFFFSEIKDDNLHSDDVHVFQRVSTPSGGNDETRTWYKFLTAWGSVCRS
jgi:hypothetical protein